MDQLYVSLATLSLFIIITGLLKEKIDKGPLSEPLIAIILGFILGPHVLNILHIHMNGANWKIPWWSPEFTLEMALMATALRLPHNYLLNTWGNANQLNQPWAGIDVPLFIPHRMGFLWSAAFNGFTNRSNYLPYRPDCCLYHSFGKAGR